MEILKKRYPDIQFLLSFFPYEQVDLSQDPSSLEQWLDRNPLEEVEVLYLIGLVGFALPHRISDWLAERKERVLVFIEEDLGAFASFSHDELLENSQIHLHYAQNDPIDELAQTFPTDRLAIYEGKSFDGQRLQRVSATLSAMYSDILYSHKIAENVIANFSRLSHCFDARGSFAGVPAIICGAGPSLEKSFGTLQTLTDHALIFAGGSAITVLTQNQIQPHFGIALDPNEEEFDRLRQSAYFEGPFLFAPRLHRDVFSTANGPFGYMKTDTGGLVENWLETKLGFDWSPVGPDLGEEAFSVTTLAISYAVALGCNPIILAGVDLSYQQGKRYAGGIEAQANCINDPRALEKPLKRKDIYGNEVETLLKWVMEADCISSFAKKHSNTLFLNATEGGLGFQGMKDCPLEKALKRKNPRDYRAAIHQWIQTKCLPFDQDKFIELIGELEASLQRCATLCVEIILEVERRKESGKFVLFESDLREEIAYECFLEGIDMALNHVLIRYYPHLDPEEGKWQRLFAKYRELKLQIEKFRNILQNTSPAFNL